MPKDTNISNDSIDKNEKYALIIGASLIFLVFVITFFRSSFFENLQASLKQSEESNTINDTSKVSLDNYKTISSKELQRKIMEGENPKIIDIRSFNLYIAEHILDSTSMPIVENVDFSKINRSDFLIIIGKDSNDTDIIKFVELLNKNNFTNYKVLAGGMIAWISNGGQTITFSNPSSFVAQSKVEYMEADQVNELINNSDNNKLFILDVSDNNTFRQGHLRNAVNIPLMEIEKRRKEIPSYRKIIVTGSTEIEEFQAAAQINDIYLTLPTVMKGAIPKWKELGFEIVNQ